MLLSTGRTVALRCPLCGRFSLHSLSLFTFGRKRPLRVTCGCGFTKMTISSPTHKNYFVQLICLACTGTHRVHLKHKEFFGDSVIYLRCPEIDAIIGYIGSDRAVRDAVAADSKRVGSIANDLGFSDLFNQPEVMMEVLGHLHFLAENENLNCQCGNCQIEVDVFPDKLELRCVSCHSLLIVYAETKEDLAAVRRIPRIVMSERGFASIDASKMSQ